MYSQLASQHDRAFLSYRDLADTYEDLEREGMVEVVSADRLAAAHSRAAAFATIADLADDAFLSYASRPREHQMPAIVLGSAGGGSGGRPSWQTFVEKIPSPLRFDGFFRELPLWKQHILNGKAELPGEAWSLSYEAGSAVALNFYLEAAEELGAAPITTSHLHHGLVLRKIKRLIDRAGESIEILDSKDRNTLRLIAGYSEMLGLFRRLFPPQGLERVSYSMIERFRQETSALRLAYIAEVEKVMRLIDAEPSSSAYERQIGVAFEEMKRRCELLDSELQAKRDQLFPRLLTAVAYGVAGSGLLGTLASFVAGLSPAGVVAASGVAAGGAITREAASIWAEYRATKRSQNSSVMYLARIGDLL